jgi:hypothetical protein
MHKTAGKADNFKSFNGPEEIPVYYKNAGTKGRLYSKIRRYRYLNVWDW